MHHGKPGNLFAAGGTGGHTVVQLLPVQSNDLSQHAHQAISKRRKIPGSLSTVSVRSTTRTWQYIHPGPNRSTVPNTALSIQMFRSDAPAPSRASVTEPSASYNNGKWLCGVRSDVGRKGQSAVAAAGLSSVDAPSREAAAELPSRPPFAPRSSLQMPPQREALASAWVRTGPLRLPRSV